MQLLIDDFFAPTHLHPLVIGFRLLLAICLGALIGLERELQDRPAGLRTHMLVSLAAALFVIVAIELVHSRGLTGSETQMDPIRVIEAVTAGVAFLGAGAIIRGRRGVHGLTTGTALWLAGGIGVACGTGLGLVAAGAAVAALIILVVLRWLERHIGPKTRPPE